eukprot:748836-Hanusia_phi.AAC.1
MPGAFSLPTIALTSSAWSSRALPRSHWHPIRAPTVTRRTVGPGSDPVPYRVTPPRRVTRYGPSLLLSRPAH